MKGAPCPAHLGALGRLQIAFEAGPEGEYRAPTRKCLTKRTPRGFCTKLSAIYFTLFYSLNSLFGFITVGLFLGLHFHSLKAFESPSPVCFPVRAQHVSRGEMKSSEKNVNAAGGPSAEQAGK